MVEPTALSQQNGNLRLIVSRLSPSLVDDLWKLIADEQSQDVLAPVTVVAPTRYAGLSLRQELGRKGFANVRFIAMPVLAELLGSASLDRQGRKPLTSVVQTLVLRRVLDRATGPLARVKDHPSTQTSVRSAFGQLRRTQDSVLSALSTRDGLAAQVARMYGDFRGIVATDWYDIEDLVQSATGAVDADRAPGLADLGLIVFYLPREPSPGEVALMEALAGTHRCAVVLGLTGDESADVSTRRLSARLGSAFDVPQVTADASDSLPLLSGPVHLHIAPSAHEELRWVIRQVAHAIEREVTPLHRMAVLYRMADPYATLVRDEFRMAGIPMAGPDRETLANTAVGRTLRGMLSLTEARFQRSDVMEWLNGCPVRPRGVRAENFNPSQWDAISRKAGIVGGLEQWRTRLDVHARRLNGDADRREASGDISIARARGMRSEASASMALRSFIDKLASDLQPPPDGSNWRLFGEWAKGLLNEYLAHDASDAEAMALERIQRALDEFNSADSIDSAAGIQSFQEMVAEALQAPFGHLGPTGQGVFVSPFSAAAGLNFDAVWLVGMVEGAVPPAIRPDPLLADHDWISAGGADRARQRMAEERYQYLAAASGARRRTLSYSITHPASQRQAYPSRWFLEQASALHGATVDTGNLLALGDREWLSIDESVEASLNDVGSASLADEHDYRLTNLLRWRRAGRSLLSHPFVDCGPLAGTLNAVRNRSLPRLTKFDGNLASMAGRDRFGVGLRHTPISPTGLESWATCPYRYFLGHVLGLRSLDTPEETIAISPLDRGALVHEILETFIRETVEHGKLPSAQEMWSPDDRQRLMNIAAGAFRTAEMQGLTGKKLLWEMDREAIRSDLESFLEQDVDLRARQRTHTIGVETAFGFGGDTTDVTDPETGIRFRGSIDRLDVSADGESIMVIDYKTGSPAPFAGLEEDVIDRGRHLQLGVYSLAAQTLFPGARSIHAAYWFATNRGGFNFAPTDHFDITDDSTAQRFREGVSGIVAGINSGLFPANPGPLDRGQPSNCRFCDFDPVCPSRRLDVWRRKKSDAVLSDFLELAGEDAEAGP